MKLDFRPENLPGVDSYETNVGRVWISVVRQPASAYETYCNQHYGIKTKNLPGKWAVTVCVGFGNPVWWDFRPNLHEAIDLAENVIEEFLPQAN